MKDVLETQIRKILREYIEQGAKKFVIFPYNNLGEFVRRILNQTFSISELFMVDNTLCNYNPDIKNIQYLKSYLSARPLEDIYIIIASQNAETVKYIKEQCLQANLISLFNPVRPRGSYGSLVENQYLVESIGAFCCFAAGSAVVEDHPLNFVTQHTFMYSPCITPEINNQQYTGLDFNKGVVIGNDVWLGRNVIITNGVKIGNGVRAAAGAVITKDVPDYAVVAGVPARIIKYRFTPDQIIKLNEIAWWEWPDEKIRECYEDFLDIDVFLQKHYPVKN